MSKKSDETVEKIIDLMSRDASHDAPPDAVRWSKNLFRARTAAPKKSLAQKIKAVLQMDLSPNAAVFGERSAGAAARQMLFQAGESAIDLRVTKNGDAFSLHGQILGEGFADCAVKLAGDSGAFEARANALSEFTFAEIPRGTYDLTVQSDAAEILVESVDL